jgi:hypothetical protein
MEKRTFYGLVKPFDHIVLETFDDDQWIENFP